MLTERNIVLGKKCAIREKGPGLLFELQPGGFTRGFIIRFNGTLYAYRNQCPHAGTELDWVEGQFFDQSKKYLTCSTHGALFEATSGQCIHGPCLGQSLRKLPIQIIGENIEIDPESQEFQE